jgi:hypothetical protein
MRTTCLRKFRVQLYHGGGCGVRLRKIYLSYMGPEGEAGDGTSKETAIITAEVGAIGMMMMILLLSVSLVSSCHRRFRNMGGTTFYLVRQILHATHR